MRQAVGDQELDLGFKLDKRRSRRRQPIAITDLDFADDIALLSEEIQKAQELLTRVENEAAKIGLHLNDEKTEAMVYNIPTPSPLKTIGGNAVKIVENFKYLGSWIRSSEQDIKVRKALAWEACHKLNRVWSSPLKRNIKVRLFLATAIRICSTLQKQYMDTNKEARTTARRHIHANAAKSTQCLVEAAYDK